MARRLVLRRLLTSDHLRHPNPDVLVIRPMRPRDLAVTQPRSPVERRSLPSRAEVLTSSPQYTHPVDSGRPDLFSIDCCLLFDLGRIGKIGKEIGPVRETRAREPFV
jgi:hypothetical protein